MAIHCNIKNRLDIFQKMAVKFLSSATHLKELHIGYLRPNGFKFRPHEKSTKSPVRVDRLLLAISNHTNVTCINIENRCGHVATASFVKLGKLFKTLKKLEVPLVRVGQVSVEILALTFEKLAEEKRLVHLNLGIDDSGLPKIIVTISHEAMNTIAKACTWACVGSSKNHFCFTFCSYCSYSLSPLKLSQCLNLKRISILSEANFGYAQIAEFQNLQTMDVRGVSDETFEGLTPNLFPRLTSLTLRIE